MKKIISVIVCITLCMSAIACSMHLGQKGNGTEEKYGEELYSCDPDNLLSFQGIYADENRITLVFDTTFTEEEPMPRIMKYLVEDESRWKYESISIITSDGEFIKFRRRVYQGA